MKIEHIRNKIVALRNAADDLLSELESLKPSTPRKRQNKREERKLDFKAMYSKTKS